MRAVRPRNVGRAVQALYRDIYLWGKYKQFSETDKLTQKAILTRQCIIDTAWCLFATKGYEQTTMRVRPLLRLPWAAQLLARLVQIVGPLLGRGEPPAPEGKETS